MVELYIPDIISIDLKQLYLSEYSKMPRHKNLSKLEQGEMENSGVLRNRIIKD